MVLLRSKKIVYHQDDNMDNIENGVECINVMAKLLVIDKPNKNGRVYTKECIENALKNCKKEHYITKNIDHLKSRDTFDVEKTNEGTAIVEPKINLMDTVGVAMNFKIDGEFLTADCIFISKLMEPYKGMTINVRPIGTGKINENGVVENYEIHGMTLVLPPK